MKPDQSVEATRWILQAENDLGFAKLALQEGYYSQACFISQQAAEKALKSISYGRGDRFVVGHSLQELLNGLVGTHGELESLREAACRLDQYYVATRYPDALPGGLPFETYSRGQAEEAVAMASEIVTSARAFLE
ncbi:MAG: HEPN domain-containing protein [Dehalococcoidia bacterium]|nr:HEPN domain-containing protein [Dehalococcoidia bacterium]